MAGVEELEEQVRAAGAGAAALVQRRRRGRVSAAAQVGGADRVQRRAAQLRAGRGRLHRGRDQAARREPQDPRDPRAARCRAPACACRCSRATRCRSTPSSSGRIRSPRRWRSCAHAPGVVVTDVPNPLEATGRDPVFVGRVRKDPTVEHGLALFVSATTCARARRSTRCRSPRCCRHGRRVARSACWKPHRVAMPYVDNHAAGPSDPAVRSLSSWHHRAGIEVSDRRGDALEIGVKNGNAARVGRV